MNGRKKKTLLYRRKTKLFCSQSTIWWLMWRGTDSIWESQIQIANWLNDQVAKVESTAETNKQMLASEKCGPQVFLFFLLTSIFSTSNQKSFFWKRRTKKRPISAVFFYLPLISGPARLLDVDWWVSESPVKEMEANFKVKSAHSQSQSVSKADSQLSLLLIFFFFFLQCVCRAQMLSQYTAIFSLSPKILNCLWW